MRDRVGEPHGREPRGWMTTGVPRAPASARRVCSVACRQRALVGANVSAVEGRPWIRAGRRRSIPREPRLAPREDDDAAAERPLAAGDLVRDVEAAARGRRVGGADRDASHGRSRGRPRAASVVAGEIGLQGVVHPAEADGRGARHPADDAVAEHVALTCEPVAAAADDRSPRTEPRASSTGCERPAPGARRWLADQHATKIRSNGVRRRRGLEVEEPAAQPQGEGQQRSETAWTPCGAGADRRRTPGLVPHVSRREARHEPSARANDADTRADGKRGRGLWSDWREVGTRAP